MTSPTLDRAAESVPPPPSNPLMQPGPPPRRPRPRGPLPPFSGWRWVTIGAVAIMGDLAVHTGVSTASGAAATMLLIALIRLHRPFEARIEFAAVGLAVVLGILLMLRSSPWIVLPVCVAIGGVLVLLASGQLHPGRRPWITALTLGFSALIDTSQHGRSWAIETGRSAGYPVGSLLRAAAIVGSLLAVLLGLLSSGDIVAASLLTSGDPQAGLVHTAVVISLAFFAVAGTFLAVRPSGPSETHHNAPVRFTLECQAAVWTTAIVLGGWAVLQVSVALGAADRVLSTEGLTVAQYAREGFFQLVAVAAITLTTIWLTTRISGLSSSPAGGTFRAGVSVVGVGLIVLIAASFARMWFYMEAFGLTMLRLSVTFFLGWLALYSLVAIARSVGQSWAARWSASLAALSLALTAALFAMVNPEALVVRINLSMPDPDLDYLTELSNDARSEVLSGKVPEELIVWACTPPDGPGYGVFGWNQSQPPACD